MLITQPDGVYVDATVGGGGHSAALLKVLRGGGELIGVDRDPEALREATARLGAAPNFSACHGTFSNLRPMLAFLGHTQIDGLLLDLGVSSHQLDHGPRGFSHRYTAPLDMRMDPSYGPSARALVNSATPQELIRTLYRWGEEPRARQISAAIVRARPVSTTTELAQLVRRNVPVRHEAKAVARVFQALRIAVNQEIAELEAVLQLAPGLIRPAGRLVVISYHSLEDRRVKRMMRDGNLQGEPKRDLYGNSLSPWCMLTRKPVIAPRSEVQQNPRARSARLRAAERVPVRNRMS